MPTQWFEISSAIALGRRWRLTDAAGRTALTIERASGSRQSELLVFEEGQPLVPAVVLKAREEGPAWLRPRDYEVFAPGGAGGIRIVRRVEGGFQLLPGDGLAPAGAVTAAKRSLLKRFFLLPPADYSLELGGTLVARLRCRAGNRKWAIEVDPEVLPLALAAAFFLVPLAERYRGHGA